MSTVIKDLGAVSAYAYAVEKGYTGTEEEFAELMADYAAVGQRAEDAAESALNSKTAAQTAATTATNKASEATTAAQTATTKAGEASQSASQAQASAQTASTKASEASTSAQTASAKASEASQSATTASNKASEASGYATSASQAKTDAESARDSAQGYASDAQGYANDAQASAESISASASQIAKNSADIAAIEADASDIEELFKTTENVDFSTAHYRKGLVNSSNKWSTSTGFYSYYFAIESGQYNSATVTANANYPANISFLASDSLVTNVTPTWASGYTGRQTIEASGTQKFDIPDDCIYIVVAKTGSNNADLGPASMVFESMADIPQATPPLGLHEFPPTESALNIVKRCRQMTDIKWTPAVDLPRYILAQTSNPPDTAEAQRYKGTFKAGTEYKGIPYGRTTAMRSYGYSYATIGSYIDFGTFVSSVSNPKSKLSVRDVGSVSGHTSVIYASVCSGLACYALGVNEVATANIPSISGLSLVGKVNNNGTLLSDALFKIGDVLNLYDNHVGIITDIIRDSEGVIQSVEISECTASGLADKNYLDGLIGGIARRKGWTRWHLFYERWKDYSLYRYSGTVTYTPSQYVNVGDEFDGYVVEHFPIMPYEGEGFAYKTGYIPNNAVELVYTLSDYAYVKVFKDGTEISGSPFALTEGADSIDISTITAGEYLAYLCNITDGDVVNCTYPCHWSIT